MAEGLIGDIIIISSSSTVLRNCNCALMMMMAPQLTWPLPISTPPTHNYETIYITTTLNIPLFLKTHGTAVSCYTGEEERKQQQDEDQTRPATHSPKLLRDKGHRGTTDTEGQRTLRDKGH